MTLGFKIDLAAKLIQSCTAELPILLRDGRKSVGISFEKAHWESQILQYCPMLVRQVSVQDSTTPSSRKTMWEGSAVP